MRLPCRYYTRMTTDPRPTSALELRGNGLTLDEPERHFPMRLDYGVAPVRFVASANRARTWVNSRRIARSSVWMRASNTFFAR